MKYRFKCEVTKIIDADTVKLDVDMGLRIHFEDNFRLARINAPELRTTEGKNAQQFLAGFINEARKTKCSFFVETGKHGKYRWLAELLVQPPGVKECINVNTVLVENGHAKYWS